MECPLSRPPRHEVAAGPIAGYFFTRFALAHVIAWHFRAGDLPFSSLPTPFAIVVGLLLNPPFSRHRRAYSLFFSERYAPMTCPHLSEVIDCLPLLLLVFSVGGLRSFLFRTLQVSRTVFRFSVPPFSGLSASPFSLRSDMKRGLILLLPYTFFPSPEETSIFPPVGVRSIFPPSGDEDFSAPHFLPL